MNIILFIIVYVILYVVVSKLADYHERYISAQLGRMYLQKSNNTVTFRSENISVDNNSFTISQIQQLVTFLNASKTGYLGMWDISRRAYIIKIGCQYIDIDDLNKAIKYLNKRGYAINYIDHTLI